MKRADLTTRRVLSAIARHQASARAWDVLCVDYPPKVVRAALQREVDADHLDYGVWLGRPWLTPKGRIWLMDNAGEE